MVAFYEQLDRFTGTAFIQEKPSLSGSNTATYLSYPELEKKVQQQCQQLKATLGLAHPEETPLLALGFDPSIAAVVFYLAALRCQVPLLLVDTHLPEALRAQMFKQLGVSGYFAEEKLDLFYPFNNSLNRSSIVKEPSSQVAVLLSTSGSSGSPKAVMLSTKNLNANAQSIVGYLPIDETDVAISSLPLHYSYGLSILNTHLARGAAFVLTEAPMLSKEFWQQVETHQVSSLSGVPFHYQMLERLRIERKDLPALKYLTQAGGKLKAEKVRHFAQIAKDKGWQFFVMYGQTEATARMAYMPANKVLEQSEGIGKAIPGGRFELRDINDQTQITAKHQAGELYYYGDNVMLGYAEQAQDWQQAAQPLPYLATGDMAEWVGEGWVKIVGRLSRFIKIQGKRYQLDHLEKSLQEILVKSLGKNLEKGLEQTTGNLLCCGQDDKLYIAYERYSNKDTLAESAKKQIAAYMREVLGLHSSHWALVEINTVPRLASGKTDFTTLLETCQQQESALKEQKQKESKQKVGAQHG